MLLKNAIPLVAKLYIFAGLSRLRHRYQHATDAYGLQGRATFSMRAGFGSSRMR